MNKSNWPFGTDLSHPNFTGVSPNRSSGYAPNSERPACGWCFPLALGIGFMVVLMLAPHFFAGG